MLKNRLLCALRDLNRKFYSSLCIVIKQSNLKFILTLFGEEEKKIKNNKNPDILYFVSLIEIS